MNEPKFYIYEHWRPDIDVPFYVGLGQGRRANVMYKRNYKHEHVQLTLELKGMCVEVRLVAEGLYAEEAKRIEQERIAFWKNEGVALTNLTDGGDGSLNPSDETRALMRAAKLGRKLSEEHKRKIGEASRRSLADPEVKRRLSESIKRGKSTPEAFEKASKSQKARIRTKEHYEKVAAALRGKKLSPEHREKTRLANLGRKQPQEEIERRRAANIGKKRSPEFCAHMKAVWTPERRARQAQTLKNNKELVSNITLEDLLGDK